MQEWLDRCYIIRHLHKSLKIQW